jgi:hypothetical protein
MSTMYRFDIPDFVSVPIVYNLSVKGLIANAFPYKSIFSYVFQLTAVQLLYNS